MSLFRSGYSVNLYVVHLSPSTPVDNVKYYLKSIIINKLISNLKTDVFGLIIVGDTTSNPFNEINHTQFKYIDIKIPLQQSSKIFLDVLDNLDLNNCNAKVDPIDGLIIAYKHIENLYASKKSWTKNINFIIGDDITTDNYEINNLSNLINQLHIGLNFIKMSDHENPFIDRLSPYIEDTTINTLNDQLDQLKKPHPSASKSAAQSSRFNISNEISIKVKYQKAVGKATKLPLKSLRADTNSKVSTSQVHRLGDSQVDTQNLIKAYHYGSILVPRPDESEGGFVEFTTEAGIDFLSTFPASTFKRDMVIGEPSFIYADQSDGSSGLALSSFINALDKNELIALVRYARTKDEKPYLGLCLPVIDGQTEYLQYLRIPFADQTRNYSFPSLERIVTKSGEPLQNHKYLPTDKMCLAMDNLVNSMDLHNSDDKRTWFDIYTSYTPAHHRIYQAVIHGASTGSIIKEELPEAHPELKKYLEPPSFAQKRSIDALEDCKNEFNLTKPTPKAKVSRHHSKGDVREAQEINIDDLLGGKTATSPRPVDKTIEGDAKKGTDGTFTPDQVWPTLKNIDDPEEVYEIMSASIREALGKHTTDNHQLKIGLQHLRDFATKNNIAEDYNELLRNVKEDTHFWSFLRANEGEKLSLITSGEDEHGTSEVTSSQSRNFMRE